MNDLELAHRLAADLAGAQVDPNEAEKALAYLRSVDEPQRFLDFLRVVTQNGRIVIRSGQTLGYYVNLLGACERHLRGLDAPTARYTLGWAIRLLRYYRTVPPSQRPDVWFEHHPTSTTPERSIAAPASASAAAAPPPARPAASEIPAVGEVFTGKITEMDASMAVIEVPGFPAERAVALLSADVADLRRYRVGNAARIEVTELKTQRSGRVLLLVKPAPRPKA